jgi:hypothetical protein
MLMDRLLVKMMTETKLGPLMEVIIINSLQIKNTIKLRTRLTLKFKQEVATLDRVGQGSVAIKHKHRVALTEYMDHLLFKGMMK